MSWRISVATMEFRKIIAYRSDFWVTFLGQIFIQYFVATSLWQEIFSAKNIHEMNGFTLGKISLFYLIVPIGNRILTGESIGFLSREIYDGTFTKYLIYPLSFFQYKTLTYMTHSLFYMLQLLLFVLLYCIFIPDASITFLNTITGMVFFLFAAFTYLGMSLCIEIISLWADNIWSLMLALRFIASFLGGGYLPLAFFPAWSIPILKITPFPYLIDLPVKIILGDAKSNEILSGSFILFFWIISFHLILKFLWKRGQKNFSGVGL